MKVLTIIHYDTMQGSVEDIVQIPEGKTEDEVFLTWIRIKRKKPDLTMEEVTKNDGYLYHWEACDVKTFDYSTEAAIALGSNLGDREWNLNAAMETLKTFPEIKILKVSKFIETEPVGGPPGQDPYLNGAAVLSTSLTPQTLLATLLTVEHRLGRVRTVGARNEPRRLDLDLLLYGSMIGNFEADPCLLLPHPRLHERLFVLQPLAEIAPDWVHPIQKKTIKELLTALSPC